MGVAVLHCEQVEFSYGRGSPRIFIPTLAVDPGVHYIVGLNGSGKSTLLKLLSGVVRPQRGAVQFQGESIARSQTYRELCRTSGYLWQNFALAGGTPVQSYLQYRAWLHGVAPTDTAEASGRLRPITRSSGLSLGDRACLALSIELGLPALTADRRWKHVRTTAKVELIR